MSTVRLTVAQALVRFLAAQYTERDGSEQRAIPRAWGIFGHGNVGALAPALAEAADELPFHQPKHEQAMVHAALGYARATRRLATFACTASIGPGALNLVTGAGTATANRLPVLLLPADTFATRGPRPVLQELEVPGSGDVTVNDCLRPVSRFFDRVQRPEQLPHALLDAFGILFDPAATGAVTLALPQDVQAERFDWPDELFARRVWHVPRRPPEPVALERAAALLRGARAPFVIAGGGVQHSAAEAELARFCSAFGLPAAETSAGKGVLAGYGGLLGGLGVNGTGAANAVAAEADVVLCAGTRLTDFTTASRSLFRHPEVAFVGLNVDAADARKLAAAPLVCDARAGLEALLAQLAGWRPPPAWAERAAAGLRDWRATMAPVLATPVEAPLTQASALGVLNEHVRAGDVIVAAAGSPPGDLLKLWETPPGSRTHLEFGFSCMGHEIPAALGWHLAQPEGQVIAALGDGTFLMAPTEIVTAVQDGLDVVLVVFLNGGYQSIHQLQRSATGISFGNEFRRRSGSRLDGELVEVDIAASARAFGARACEVQDAAGLRAALAASRAGGGVTVIAARVRPEPLPATDAWWQLGVPGASTERQRLYARPS